MIRNVIKYVCWKEIYIIAMYPINLTAETPLYISGKKNEWTNALSHLR